MKRHLRISSCSTKCKLKKKIFFLVNKQSLGLELILKEHKYSLNKNGNVISEYFLFVHRRIFRFYFSEIIPIGVKSQIYYALSFFCSGKLMPKWLDDI